MAAFLQRYVLENEFLRAARAKAEESEAEVRERLRQTEGKLVKALAATPPAPRFGGPERMMTNARKAMWTVGMPKVGGGRGGGGGAAGAGATGGGEEGAVGGGGEGQVAQVQAKRGSFSRGQVGSRAQRLATANAQGELRYTRGIVAELSFLLSATESDRDSLASLLVIAEQNMERLLRAQEELALKLAWGNIARLQAPQQQQGLSIDDGVGVIPPVGEIATMEGEQRYAASTAQEHPQQEEQQQQQQRRESSVSIATEESSGNQIPVSVEEHEGDTNEATGLKASAVSFERSRAALESLELRRRVRDLEVLLKAAEIEARETENENQRLRRRHGASPLPEASWGGGGGGGVVCSTADSRQHPHSSCVRASGITTPTISSTGSGNMARHVEEGDVGGQAAGGGPDDPHGHKRSNQEVVSNNGDLGETDAGAMSGAKFEQGCSLSSPMLSAAEVGGGSGSPPSRAGGNQPAETVAVEMSARESMPLSEGTQPLGWGWAGEDYPGARPKSRCRPRSSPFAGHQHRGSSAGDGDGCGTGDGSGVGSTGGEEALLIKGKLAWVLGLPAETTTENELLAEIMHLVVERGTSATDVEVLKAQLDKIDEQSPSLTRLAAVASAGDPSHAGDACDDGGRRKSAGKGDGGLDFVDMGVGYSGSKDTFLSSLCHTDGCGDAAGAGVGAGVVHVAASRAQQQAKPANNSAAGRRRSSSRAVPNQAIDRKVSTPAAATAVAATAAAAAAGPASRPAIPRPGGGGKSTKAEGSEPKPNMTVAATKRRLTGTGEGTAPAGAGSADGGVIGSPTAALAAAGGNTAVEVELPLDENTIRTSFPKTLQGRVVSIDIFCTKV